MMENAAQENVPVEEREAKQFQPGDLAVYPAHGVGRIESIEIREVNGDKQEFYILNIFENSMVIMIPVKNARLVCLRDVIRKDEIPKVYSVIKRKARVFINHMNWNRRYKEYMDKIKTGSLFDVAEVFRDLFNLRSTKELSFGERKLLDIAQGLLLKELCVAMKSDEKTIMNEIKSFFDPKITHGNA